MGGTTWTRICSAATGTGRWWRGIRSSGAGRPTTWLNGCIPLVDDGGIEMWLQAREGASGYAYVEVFVLCKELPQN